MSGKLKVGRKFVVQMLLAGVLPTLAARAELGGSKGPDGRIHLDVVVTDAEGKLVPGLKAQDFRVLDDGKERPLASFAGYGEVGRELEPPTQMVIVDNGFLEMGYMRQGLEAFLRENGGRLQQPTAIAELVPSGIRMMSRPSQDGNALAGVVSGLGATVRPRGLDTLLVSLNALVTLVKEKVNEPGRKLLVWLGPGWGTPPLPQGAFTAVDERNQRAYYAVAMQIQKLLYDAHMVLYGGYTAGEFYMRDFLKPVRKSSDMDSRGLRLNVLAIKSGGKGELPETNRDRVTTDALDHFAAEANTYYALSFDAPPAESADEFHELRVTVNRAGLTARTMTGHYNEATSSRKEIAGPAPVVTQEVSEPAQPASKQVTAAQLAEAVEAAKGLPDGEAAREIERLQLRERLSRTKLARLREELPGTKAKSALTAVGDASEFLELPQGEALDRPAPDLGEQQHIVALAVDYLSKTLPKLPDFSARRVTESYNAIGPKGGTADPNANVLRRVGDAVATVVYRDGKEVTETEAGRGGAGEKAVGLVTKGIFGPVLSTVVVDASRGDMQWRRWEAGSHGPVAVFAYRVKEADSHYAVSYAGLGDKNAELSSVKTAYHGEIAIDAASGAIERLVLEADMRAGLPIARADIMVEYGTVEIGGKSYTCPNRSVSISSGDSLAIAGNRDGRGAREVTRLNDVVFDQYHVFRSEMRILPQ